MNTSISNMRPRYSTYNFPKNITRQVTLTNSVGVLERTPFYNPLDMQTPLSVKVFVDYRATKHEKLVDALQIKFQYESQYTNTIHEYFIFEKYYYENGPLQSNANWTGSGNNGEFAFNPVNQDKMATGTFKLLQSRYQNNPPAMIFEKGTLCAGRYLWHLLLKEKWIIYEKCEGLNGLTITDNGT